jgi:hypothetical protein
MIRHRDSAVDAESLIEAHHKYIRDGLQTPFNQLRGNIHLATAYVYNQSNIGRVQWMDSEGESLLIDGKQLSRTDSRIGIETGIRALQEHRLISKVKLGRAALVLQWETMSLGNCFF